MQGEAWQQAGTAAGPTERTLPDSNMEQRELSWGWWDAFGLTVGPQ